jgi:hypothetical protein
VKPRRRILAVAGISALVVLSALVIPSETAESAKTGEASGIAWRYLLYLDADNNLDVSAGQHHEPVVEDDFAELMSVGSSEEVVCYVFVDRWSGPANLFKVHEGWMEEMTDFALNGVEANMGDPATLRSFVSYTYKASPAEHTVLMFWNHGGPTYVAYDDNGPEPGVSDVLTHWEVFDALKRYRVDVIGTDECLVGQAEVAYDYAMRGLDCDYLLASQTWTGWRGYPYDWTLGALVSEPTMTPREVAVMFIEQVDLLLSQPPHMGEEVNCHAAIDLKMMRSLGTSFGALCDLMAPDMGAYVHVVSTARGQAVYGYAANSIDLIDMRQFVDSLASMAAAQAVRDACLSVLSAFDQTVIALQACTSLDQQLAGLGLCFPQHEWEAPGYYGQYLFAEIGWMDFLEAYWSA